MFYNWRFEYDNDGHPVRIVFNNWNEQRDNTLGYPYAFCAGNHIFFSESTDTNKILVDMILKSKQTTIKNMK